MKSRLDRYNDNHKEPQISSRLSKNKYLYDDLNNKIGFEELVDFNTQTRIELSSLNHSRRSRESYQQLKDYQGLIKEEEKIEPTPIPVVEEQEEKVFDINSILEEARKNRSEIDELEKKRKLKNEEYNVLSDLNKKYLSKNSDNKDKDEYEGLEELINTITSKTLATDIKEEEEKDLLSDLMATNVDLQVKSPSEYEKPSQEIAVKIESNEYEDDNTKEESRMDRSFYTRSMDLSEHDFDFDEEKERKSSIRRGILIFIITIVLLAIIGVVAYFTLQHFGIDVNKFISDFLK